MNKNKTNKKIILMLMIGLLVVGSVNFVFAEQFFPKEKEDIVKSLDFFSNIRYALSNLGAFTVVGGANCWEDVKWAEIYSSYHTETCPSSVDGNPNYGCVYDIFLDNYEGYVGKYEKTAGESLSLAPPSGHYYIWEFYPCQDKTCACPTGTLVGECGDGICSPTQKRKVRTCVPPGCSWEETCQEVIECQPEEDEEEEEEVCTPDCVGKVCGPDGCGGSCGFCVPIVQECANGQCITFTAPVEIIETQPAEVQVVGDKVVGTFFLKNTGKAMTESYLLEMQVAPKGTGPFSLFNLFAVISPISETCDIDYPWNVHKTFKLEKGESVTIVIEADNVNDGNYDVYGILVDKCWYAPNNIKIEPYEGGVKIGTATVSGQGCEDVCGTLKEGETKCFIDDWGYDECIKDGECLRLDRKPCPTGEVCREGVCEEGPSGDKESLTLTELKRYTLKSIAPSFCEENKECAEREDYETYCSGETKILDIIKQKEDYSKSGIENVLGFVVGITGFDLDWFDTPEAGVCYAKSPGIDITQITEWIEENLVLVLIIAGALIVMVVVFK